MKSKFLKYGVFFILVSFIVSVEGNALACLSPFTMNYEKTFMTCNSSMAPVNPVPVQSDKNCKDSLVKDGQVHHFNSSSHFLVLKNFPLVSALFMAPTGIQFEQPSVPAFFIQDHRPPIHYSSTPLYTFHHSLLI